jgi:hypothetical protein
VSAEPADVLADLLDPLVRRVFEAAEAALGEVTFFGAFVWDNADPAADFAALLELELLRTFEAADAAFFPVTSVFLLMMSFLIVVANFGANIDGG